MQLSTMTDVQKDGPMAPAVLGYAVFWCFAGSKVPYATLLNLLANSGLASSLPDLPTPSATLRRGLLAWMHEHSVSPLLIRPVSRSPLVFALVQEEIHQPGLDLSHTIRLRVLYDALHQDLICTRVPTGPIDASCRDQALSSDLWPYVQEASLTYESSDLTRMLRVMISNLDAIRLQRGVYFVPVSQRARLKQVDDLVHTLPGSPSPLLVTLERMDDLKTRQQLARVIHADFLRELDTQEEAMRQIVTATPTLKTVTARLTSFRALHKKARVYADLLAERGAEVVHKIDQLQAQAQSLVLAGTEHLIDTEEKDK
ncbi:MAG TPA: DUF6744 family protein [Ktedonosporobacter sp.]|nr:DUF6744 family protein [Ktedonosporobacter sp.]